MKSPTTGGLQHARTTKRFVKGLNADPDTLLRAISDSTGDMLIFLDSQNSILTANPAVYSNTGYRERELIGIRLQTLYRKEHAARYTQRIVRALRVEGVWKGEVELRRKDGSSLFAYLTARRICDDKGKAAGTLVVARDLTLARLASQKSMEAGSSLRNIVDSMDDAVCVCDNSGKVQMVNAAYTRLLGCSRDELIGAVPPYPWVESPATGSSGDPLKRLQKEGVVRNHPMTWRTRKQERVQVSMSISRLGNGSGKYSGQVCTIRDVTDVRYVEEVRQTKEQLRRMIFDVRQKAVRLETLEEINKLVIRKATPLEIFRKITSSVKKLVQHDLAGFYVHEVGMQALVPRALSKMTPFSKKLGKFPLALGQGIIGRAAESGEMVWVNNAQLDPRSTYPPGMKPEQEHCIAVPLRGREEIFGVLVVARNRDPEFIEEDALVVKSLADAATVALENARLFQDQKDLRSREWNS